MSKLSRKPSPEYARPLAVYLKEASIEKQISLRKLATEIGIDSALLIRMVNGQATPDAGVCNEIADYFKIPRVQVYAMSGWLEMDDPNDRELLETLRSSILTDEYPIIERVYFNIGDQVVREQFVLLIRRLTAETSQNVSSGS